VVARNVVAPGLVLDMLRARYNLGVAEPVFPNARGIAQRQPQVATANAAEPLPDLTRVYLIHVDAGTDVRALSAALQREPGVEWAEPNYLYHADVLSSAPNPALGAAIRAADSSPAMPNDPFFSSSSSWGQPFPDLWGLFAIDAPDAWLLSEGRGTVVAVVDSGIDIDHEDLAANVWHNAGEIPGNGIDDDGNGFVDDVNGWDFTHCAEDDGQGNCLQTKNPGPDVSDQFGHGTHVAGTIAAVGNNGIGIIGIAPESQVMAVKALDGAGFGSAADLAAALVYAADNGAQVVNASWGGAPSAAIQLAVAYVLARGVVIVAAAGNEAVPIESGVSPADIPGVIAVGALTHTNDNAFFSNFGGPLSLVAPGGGDTEPASAFDPAYSVLSLLSRGSAFGQVCDTELNCRDADTCNDFVKVCAVAPNVVGDDYVREAGTSMAAPHVSGVAALVRSRHPEFTPQQVQQVLLNTADDLGAAGWDPTFGYGRVNAARAAAIEAIPVAEITTPGNRTKVWDWQFPFAVQGNAFSPGGALQDWRLMLHPQGSEQPVEVGRGNTAVIAGTLTTLDLAHVEAGASYVLELTVEDTAGHTATDTKTFLRPNPLFALIPLPDPKNAGGQDPSLSGDGTRVALQRNEGAGTAVWLYDVRSRQLQEVNAGLGDASGWLTPDGRFLTYNGFLPDGKNCDPRGTTVIPSAILYDIDVGSYKCMRFPIAPGPMDAHGTRMAFTSLYALDPTVVDTNDIQEAFLYDVATQSIRQITQGPKGPVSDSATGVANLSMSRDGTRVAFDADVDLDPTASTGGNRNAFIYDDTMQTVRQLTGRTGAPPDGMCPSLSGDGRTIAILSPSEGLLVMDLQSGSSRTVIDANTGPGCPQLSADGTQLGFAAVLDADPTVENEDLTPEAFLVDLTIGTIHQVTDTHLLSTCPQTSSPFHCTAVVAAVDAAADTLLIEDEGLVLNGLPLAISPLWLRAVPRRPNLPPRVQAPLSIVAVPGTTIHTALTAVDPDGFPLTYFMQLVPEPTVPQYTFVPVMTDHGDGTADLALTAGTADIGIHTLRIAVFNEAGGVTEQDIDIVVEAVPATATVTASASQTPRAPPPSTRTPAGTATGPPSPTQTFAPSATPTASATAAPTRTSTRMATLVDPPGSGCAIGARAPRANGAVFVLMGLLLAGCRRIWRSG